MISQRSIVNLQNKLPVASNLLMTDHSNVMCDVDGELEGNALSLLSSIHLSCCTCHLGGPQKLFAPHVLVVQHQPISMMANYFIFYLSSS